jgi:hypothetical protein
MAGMKAVYSVAKKAVRWGDLKAEVTAVAMVE